MEIFFFWEEYFTIEVANRGPKPPLEDDELFEPLRTSRGLESNQHMGLGLFVARTIVDSLDGEILVTHIEGVTTFQIRLPIDQST